MNLYPSVRATLPSLHVRGCPAFECEAQGLGGAKRKRAHFGADARVRPCWSSGRAFQQSNEVFAEVAPHKAVQDRVDATVEAGEADGERHGGVDYFQQGAFAGFG